MPATARKPNSLDRYHELLARSHAAPIGDKPPAGPLPPIRTLNLFESAELEELETQFGQQHLHLMSQAPAPAPIKSNGVATARPASDPQPGERIELVEADRIDPSPWNRKTFTEPGLVEMEGSIREHGIIQPIVLRKVGSRFQLVAGERRWRGASRVSKHFAMPSIIRELTDKQALEIQKIENLQREDLDPIEEAQCLRQMMDEFGYSLDDLKAKLGKEKSTIYASLKLASLCPEGVTLFRAGVLSPSAATRFARIPSAQLQAQAIKEAAKDWQVTQSEYSDRAVAKFIGENFMKELKGAPFKLDDATLVPAKWESGKDGGSPAIMSPRIFGGACTDCPMRAGNAPDFDAKKGRADMCLMPSCYRAKQDATFKAKTTALEQAGKAATVAPPSTFNKHGCIDSKSGLTEARIECYDAPLKKKGGYDHMSYGEMAARLKIPGILAQNPVTGEILTLIDKSAVIAAAKASGLIKRDDSNDKWKAEKKARAEKERKAAALRVAQLTAVAQGTSGITDALHFTFLQEALKCIVPGADYDGVTAAVNALKLPVGAGEKYGHSSRDPKRLALIAHCDKINSLAEFRAILVYLLAHREPQYWEKREDTLPIFARLLKVDLKQVATAHNAAEKAKAAKAAKAKPKDKPAKKADKTKPAAKQPAKGKVDRAKIIAAVKARWAKAKGHHAKKPVAKASAAEVKI